MFMKITKLPAAAAALVIAAVPFADAGAQDSEDAVDEVVVRAHPLSAEKLAQPVAVLTGEALSRSLAPSLAETLSAIPGVHSASFGQLVGRPVIRGLGGARVKTMEDRIDTMDVSVSSPDHLTTVEPFLAQSIEVLKGPSTLLYGSGAIGGVVDVHTGRIPHAVPQELEAKAELRTADNGNRRTGAARLDAGAGDFAFHLDAFYREADEFDIPGFAESALLRELEEAEEEGGEGEEEEEAFGTLPGSQLETRGGAIGVSRVGERGFFGVSVSTFQSEYGLPGGHGHEHEEGEEEEEEEEEEGNPVLDQEQTRIDLEFGLDAPMAGFSSLNFRLGVNDYEHTEFEGNGEAGTVFSTESLEGRLELMHNEIGGIEGATGVQFSSSEFSAIGEEAFVQPVDSQTFGLFYVGQTRVGETGVEFGARYEHVEHDASDGSLQRFDMGSASVGLIQPLSDQWTLSGQLDYSNRAPVAVELFSNGPHLATQSFEIGDQGLTEETATNISATLAYDTDDLYFSLSAYHTDFGDFIYEQFTGAEEDELPVLQWQQADATFTGLEADFAWNAVTWDEGSLELNAGYDVVQGRLDSGANRDLPRIPPSRFRLGTVLNWNNFVAEVVWTSVSSQRDVSDGELPTAAYDDLRVHLAYPFQVGDTRLEFFVTGRNLTDDEQRLHTSFIKDFAPQPGRIVEAGVSLQL